MKNILGVTNADNGQAGIRDTPLKTTTLDANFPVLEPPSTSKET